MNILKRIFCKHEYKNMNVFTLLGERNFDECKKCGKRINIKNIPRKFEYEIEDLRAKGWNIE